MTDPRNLLHRLLEYIIEQARDINPRSYRMPASGIFVKRPQALINLPGVEFNLLEAGDHIWLRVARLDPVAPPDVPTEQQDLLQVSADPEGPLPSLLDYAAPQGRAILASYTDAWLVWANAELPRRRTIALYGELFALQHQLEADETAKPQELVWGIGIASWRLPHPDGPIPLEYPVLTQAMEINLDERSLAIELRPRATDTVLELDAYIASQIPGASDLDTACRAQLMRTQDRPVNPFDASSFEDVLRMVAGSLDSEGVYRIMADAAVPVPVAGDHLVVTDRWALFVRPRATSYLTEDVLRLQEHLAGEGPLPPGPAALVTPPAELANQPVAVNFRGVSSRSDPLSGTAQDLYFPLPYNQEQVTIAQRLEHAAGVTVQGPPGTGKTHTIANIICHYLATGRRVLVTARGETALRVLQQKIPAEVRPLTVGLLASDRRSVRQFEAAVAIIQHRLSQLQPEQARENLDLLRATIETAHEDIRAVDQRIDAIAMQQLSGADLDGVRIATHALATRYVSEAARHGWFDDTLSLLDHHAPPLDTDAETRLRAARRRIGRDLPYLLLRTPRADQLPGSAEIAALHGLLAQIRTIEGEVTRGELLPLQSTTASVLAAAHALLPQLEAAIQRVEQLEAAQAPWALALRHKSRNVTFSAELAAFAALSTDVTALSEARLDFLKRPVELPDSGFNNPRLREALTRATQTGKPLGLMTIASAELKAQLAAIRVAGLAPATPDDWRHVLRFVDLRDQILSFTVRWNQFAGTLELPLLQAGTDALRTAEQIAVTAQLAVAIANTEDVQLPAAAQAVFEHVPADLLRGGVKELNAVREHLVRHLTRADLAQAVAGLGALQESLAGTGGSVSARLRGFIDSQLGHPEVSAERVVARYAELLAELRRIERLADDLQCVRDAADAVEQAGAPRFALRLRTVEWEGDASLADSTTPDPALPDDWRAAWTWSRIRGHLTQIDGYDELLTLTRRRQDVESDLARMYLQLVAQAAWLATKRNASPKVLQALAGYAVAIRKIGQGTGPNALRYRRDAREAMLDAAGAVPCWIMSHARVSESLPAELGRFDLVIVDEASQSDLWALPAVLRGKKILVVGDDRQVSPDSGFISAERIQELRDRFLADQPFGTEMTPEKSLYDLAARVFAAEQVMLREHFRCVPAIIDYSNRTFYGGAIQPLRVPTQSERLDPPLIDMFVADGKRDSKDRNLAEAAAITSAIETMLADAHFQGRTLGVVSLLGIEQAKTIDALVRSRCDPIELQRRNFACGDARTFQGSERDILFLSLVVDPTNARALSGAMFEQRFNVAASRARDRMILVRSVQASDLSGKDLRLGLLEHFGKTAEPVVDPVQAQAGLIGRCTSSFERELCTALVRNGFRVVPQVQVGVHRIDLVVEGTNDRRLAIECDGDEYHGPERWAQDMARQRVLERAGWIVWRCFAADWITHPERVIEELRARLATLGIGPSAQPTGAPTRPMASAIVAVQHAMSHVSSDQKGNA